MDGTIIHSGAYLCEQQVREQNERLAAIFVQQRDRLRSLVRGQIGDALEAEEIVQDVFAELISASRLMKPIEHLSAWLTRVTRNRLIDRFRRRSRRPAVAIESASLHDNAADADQPDGLLDALQLPDSEGPERAYHRDVAADAIVTALAELPREQREAFVEHELQGLTIRQIADRQGVSVNTLLARKRAAVLYLRSRLRVLYDELLE